MHCPKQPISLLRSLQSAATAFAIANSFEFDLKNRSHVMIHDAGRDKKMKHPSIILKKSANQFRREVFLTPRHTAARIGALWVPRNFKTASATRILSKLQIPMNVFYLAGRRNNDNLSCKHSFSPLNVKKGFGDCSTVRHAKSLA